MDKKDIDELNNIIKYINHAQETDDTFTQTLATISKTLPEKLLYVMNNCNNFLLAIKNNDDLVCDVYATINSADSNLLYDYIKDPQILNFSSKMTQIFCKKLLADNNFDNNYLAELLIANKSKIGKILFEKLYNLVDLQTQINLALNKKQLSGEYPSLNMLNNLSNIAYINNDFDLAIKLLDTYKNLYNNITDLKDQKVLQNMSDNSALQTISSASDYLYLVMQNSANINNYNQALEFCNKLSELSINPINFYYTLANLQVESDNIKDYENLLLKLSELNLQDDAYKIFEQNFCKYITDPTKYVKVFDNPCADHDRLIMGFHSLTKFDNINDYFNAALEIAKKTHANKYLQSQIFATCANPKLIKEYISTCNDEDIAYLKTLQSHNKYLKKVLDKGDFKIVEQSITQPNTLF